MPKQTGLNLRHDGHHWSGGELEVTRRLSAEGITYGLVLRCRFPGEEHTEYLTQDLVLQRDAVFPWDSERKAEAARNRYEDSKGGTH